MKRLHALLLSITLMVTESSEAQRILNLNETLLMACEASPDARAAKHALKAAYWNFRYHRANYLPALTLTSSPNLNRSINKVTLPDGSVKYVEQNMLSTDISLSLTQEIPITGGRLGLQSSLERLDMFSAKTTSWQAAPVYLTYTQQLLGYNALKWAKRIEPQAYAEARRTYSETVELVKTAAVQHFFRLAMAQSNQKSVQSNFAHADTLYQLAKGRYRLGTITESEMLQLEVNRLNEETALLKAGTQVEEAMQTLRSFLGYTAEDSIVVQIDSIVPNLSIAAREALSEAYKHSPDVLAWKRRRTQAEADVAYAKSQAGLKADIYLRFGLTQTASQFEEAYRRPMDQEYVSVGLTLPILDWGRGKGKVKVARSQRDLVEIQVEQAKDNFEKNIRRIVAQFNLAARRVHISRQTANTAERRYNVARRLYVLGKNNVLDLNAALSEKDGARQAALAALEEYWSLHYTLRSITLYDFEKGEELPIPQFRE